MLHPGAWTQGPAAKLRPPNRICIMLSATSDLQSVQESTEYSNSENSDVQGLDWPRLGRYQTFAGSRCHNRPTHMHGSQQSQPSGPSTLPVPC